MLSSHKTCDFKLLARPGPSSRVGKQLAAFLKKARGAFSRNTERALRADLRIFLSWCWRNTLVALPARPATVVAFIDAMARLKAPATVRRYVSSIAALHKALGQASPLESADVKFALQRMHRSKGRRQAQVQGLTWPLRKRLLEAAGDRLIDARNRALLAVAYDTLLRRSELVSLEVSDLSVEVDGSATLLLRSSKTDAAGRGAVLYLARDTVQFLKAWLERGGVGGGRLFRSVRKNGTLGKKLHPSQVPRIYKKMAQRAGLAADIVDALAGHSTRVGAVQDMIACGIELPAILQAGRWKSTRMVQRYGERLLARRSGAAQLAERQQRPEWLTPRLSNRDNGAPVRGTGPSEAVSLPTEKSIAGKKLPVLLEFPSDRVAPNLRRLRSNVLANPDWVSGAHASTESSQSFLYSR